MPCGSGVLLAQTQGLHWRRCQPPHTQVLHSGATTEGHQIQVHQGERNCSNERDSDEDDIINAANKTRFDKSLSLSEKEQRE